MAAAQSDLSFQFEGVGGATFDVVRFELIEGLSQPFRLELELSRPEPNVELDALLDSEVTFTIARDGEPVRIRNLFGEEVEDEREAAGILNAVATVDGPFNPTVIGVKQTTRPCKWYYVEQLEGEYEDTNEPEVAMVPRRGPGMYAKTGEHCPYPGVWECVERPVGTQTIAYGVPMPQVDGQDVTWRLKQGI